MLKNTFIARASDGLILCETYDTVTDSQGKFSDSFSKINAYSWETEAECKANDEKGRIG